MIPRILEYEDGRVKVTAEAFTIPELNQVILKHGEEGCEPYLTFIAHQSYPDSPYKNVPHLERLDVIIYDVKQVFGDFNENDELIEPAIEKLRSLWESPATLAADEMEEELHRWRIYLRDTPMGGEMKDRLTIVAQFEKTAASAANLRKLADNELSTKMKGNNEIGEY